MGTSYRLNLVPTHSFDALGFAAGEGVLCPPRTRVDGSWAVHRAPSDRYYRRGKGPGWLDLDVVLPLFGHGRKIAVAQVLERGSDRRRAVIRGTTGAYWLRNQFELAKSYRGAGRAEDALAVEGELRKLLAFADADHPILLELQRLQSS